jgi:hypothetical protein
MTSRFHRLVFAGRLARAGIGVVFLAASLACSSAAGDADTGEDELPLEARTLVGQVDGSDIVLGIVVDDDDVTAYACGGVDTYATHSRWFEGSFGDDGDPDAFAIELDGFLLSGERSQNAIAGSLREPDGTTRSFTTAPTDEDGLSGLYDADLDGCRTGVVLFATPDGIEGQGTYCSDGGEFIQVIILQPVELKANGVEVQIDKADGPTTFFVQPL